MSEWRRGTVTILCGRLGHSPERRTVTADVSGPFAVHRITETWRPFWAVTHVPSGRELVATGTKRAARQFCAEVADLTDWSAIKPRRRGPPPEIREAYEAARKRAES